MNVETSVREFLRENVVVRSTDADLPADESLLDSGILDSASMLVLVSFLESRFGLTISDEDLVPANFETIGAIVALVEAQGDPAGGAAS